MTRTVAGKFADWVPKCGDRDREFSWCAADKMWHGWMRPLVYRFGAA